MSNSRLSYFSNPPQKFHRQLKINSTVGSEIVPTSEAKEFIRVDSSDDDTIIAQMITSARISIENFLNKDIVSKNRTLYIPFLNDRVNLPFAPVSSISSITVDGSTASHTVKGIDNEIIQLDSLPASEVKITYITSGLTGSIFEHAIKQLVSTYYDNRSDFITGANLNIVPNNVKSILSGEKTIFI